MRAYNSFYQSMPILAEIEEDKRQLRVQLSRKVGVVIQSALRLLGINVPERM
ncbi:MAG: DALR anticodon-binding domain-containing protein [Flavobacteriaceae bacterium]|nr:DALR anticodon-binding domain-containing protein [Flavobacteriaceae bacterium]